jgi:tetratricopeptide (TPR) repeat protein
MRIIFSLIILTIFPLYSFDLDPIGKSIREGVERYKRGDFGGALESFSEAEHKEKNDSRIFFDKGTAYFKLNDFKLAERYFDKAAANSDDKELKARALFNKGNAIYKQGDKRKAIDSYLEALEAKPDFAPARKNLELIRKEDSKKQQENNQESEDQEEENKQNQNDPKQGNNPKNEQKKKGRNQSKNGNQKEEQNQSGQESKKITKEEAQRILESARQDRVKRRQMQPTNSSNNEVFW